MPNWGNIKLWAGHCYQLPHHDKICVVWIENRGGDKPFTVMGGYNRRTQDGKLRLQDLDSFPSIHMAEGKMDNVVREKTRKGYVDVSSGSYSPRLFTREEALTKIETRFLVGHSVPATVAPPPPAVVHKHKSKKYKVENVAGRVARDIEI